MPTKTVRSRRVGFEIGSRVSYRYDTGRACIVPLVPAGVYVAVTETYVHNIGRAAMVQAEHRWVVECEFGV